MTLIEQIKSDWKSELGNSWDSVPMHVAEDSPHVLTVGGLIVATTFNDQTARRIARVPDMEEALLAAEELANAVDHERNMPCQDIDMQLRAIASVNDALAAYRKATGTE